MKNHPLRFTIAPLALMLIGANSATSLPIWGHDKVAFQSLKDAGGQFSMEYPVNDWQRLPGGGPVLFTLAQKSAEAVVVVVHSRLRLALEADEITDLFAELEGKAVMEDTPTAKDVHARIADNAGGRVVVIDFQRDGFKGSETVRQYVFPVGADMYRLICSASVSRFLKYEPVFARIAESFRPTV